MKDYFPDEKVIGVNAHQKHGVKRDALEHYLKGKSFDQLIIIGDSQSDMDLVEVSGGTTYYYTHPHIIPNDKVEADHTISDLRGLLQELD